MADSAPPSVPTLIPKRKLARNVFTSFLLTFLAARILVILIMGREIPDMFLHMGETHVHHLNYGIFLLCITAGVQLFFHLTERERWWCSIIYGFALALIFDEFGMWLHLGGSYWQRTSYDGVIVVASLFGMIAFAPRIERLRAHHWVIGIFTLLSVVFFYFLLFQSMNYAGQRFGPLFQRLEQSGPQ